MTQLSDDPHDKLHAALNHDWDDPHRNFPVDYLRACARWFAALSPRERTAANAAMVAFGRGDGSGAEEFARDLPPAPRFPLAEE